MIEVNWHCEMREKKNDETAQRQNSVDRMLKGMDREMERTSGHERIGAADMLLQMGRDH